MIAALLGLVLAPLLPPVQDCYEPAPGFGAWGVAWGPNGGVVYASAVYDDGQGPALYVGGGFDIAGETIARSIARFDGTSWQALPGPGGAHVIRNGGSGVRALAVYDDGSGPELYVAGDFETSLGLPQHGIAKWNGTTWTSVVTLTSQYAGFVGAADMLVWDDGTGPALYFGGTFNKIDGNPASSIAKYDGSGLSALGGGYTGSLVGSLAVFDDGTGEKLYAGGWYHVTNQCVQSWDGSSWALLPGPFDSSVEELFAHDDGTGTKLYAGGTFSTPAQRIVRWDGSSWTAVGSGVQFFPTAMATHDDGSGTQLYAIGRTYASPPPPGWEIRAARWDGAAWEYLQEGLSADAFTLCEFHDGVVNALYAGGYFAKAGSQRADHVAKWTSSGWSAAYSSDGLAGESHALFAFDDGSGYELFADAGELFVPYPGPSVCGAVRWTGTQWDPVPGTFDGTIRSFASFDAGSGPELYAGGAFTDIDGSPVKGLARFDGTQWYEVGGGVTDNGFPGAVWALCVHDFGAGPQLVVAGSFDAAGGESARNIGAWDGADWTLLDVGISGDVYAVASYDDGSGAKLYAGGDFVNASGTQVNYITRWNGTTWEALGTGLNKPVHALTVADLGGGPKLYVGGDFWVADGVNAPSFAVFDGTSFSALLNGGLAFNNRVSTIVVHDEGEGPQLYVGGRFTQVGVTPAFHVARWNGAFWLPLDDEPSDEVNALISFDEGLGFGPALFAVGRFDTVDGTPSMCVARIAPDAPCAPVVYCTSKVNSLGCTPAMYVTGSTSLAVNNLRLHAGNVINNKNGLLFWSYKPFGAPFQGGHLCCKPPIVRTGVQSSAGNPPPNDCSGSLHFHWNQAYVNQHGLSLGDWYYCQYWSRDPQSASTTSLSDATRFLLTP